MANQHGNQHVINIIKKGEDESAVLDEDNLKELLINTQARDLPVAFYSICGSFSSGKSFLWNQFVRYLRNTHFFLHDLESEENLERYFEWEGGTDRCTEGILVYKRPFILKTSAFDKVALFLMDTQGMFDNVESGGKSGMIVALSFLISSLQLYNVSTKIESSHLQYSYKFSTVWKIVQDSTSDNNNSGQSLMFIVRDWRKTKTYKLGLDGGKAYVDNEMKIDESQAYDQRNVRREIRQNFKEVSGFLLPEPGEDIINMEPGQRECQRKDVTTPFYESIERLFKHLCSRDQIALKTINGVTERGELLYDYIVGTARKGQGFEGIAENFRSFVENDYQYKMRVLTNDCLTDYILRVCTEFQNNVERPECDMVELNQRHEAFKSEILLKYDRSEKPVKEELERRWKTILERLIDGNFEKFEICAKSVEIFNREIKSFDEVLRSNAQSVKDGWDRTIGPKVAARERSQKALETSMANIKSEIDECIATQCCSHLKVKAQTLLDQHLLRIDRIMAGVGITVGSLIVGAASGGILFAIPAVYAAAEASAISTGLIITSSVIGSGIGSSLLSGVSTAAFNLANPVEELIKNAWGQGEDDLTCIPAEVAVPLSYGVVKFLRVNK